jgi:hypothetical protein
MEFAHVATVIGVIIIKELFVVNKSVLPVQGNSTGIAGRV